jgi:hypothetical protein
MIKYNVIYDKETDITVLRSNLETAGAIIHDVFSNIGVLTLSAESMDFASIPGIAMIEEDMEVVATESFEWHQLRLVSPGLPMSNFYKVSNYGDGVDVYVVDSGIDDTHPEFSHTVINKLFAYDNDFTPSNGHGTSVASVIGGNTLGVSKNVKLHDVKIPTGIATTYSVLLSAFDAILNHHDVASTAVVNCSWVVAKSQILDTKINALYADNLIVVAAAGNFGAAADNYSPVGLDMVLGVGASDAYDRVVSWGGSNNWGPEVDIFAPGIDVTVANMGETTKESSGTSIAAGVASGAVAQYIVENPSLTAAEIQNLVISECYQDMLFRNESVYGTTPNRLLKASVIANIITGPGMISVQKGTTYELVLGINALHASELQFNNIVIGGEERIISLPSWITVVGNTLIISPPSELSSGRYIIPVRANNSEGEKVETRQFNIDVYESTPEESTEGYRYFAESENSEVTVVTANCASFQCTQGFGTCNKASFPCICNTSQVCGTFFSS